MQRYCYCRTGLPAKNPDVWQLCIQHHEEQSPRYQSCHHVTFFWASLCFDHWLSQHLLFITVHVVNWCSACLKVTALTVAVTCSKRQTRRKKNRRFWLCQPQEMTCLRRASWKLRCMLPLPVLSLLTMLRWAAPPLPTPPTLPLALPPPAPVKFPDASKLHL